jgi:hypothetical protein
MDAKGFFLGLIAAVVLFMLWKKESGSPNYQFHFPGLSSSPGVGGGCGCGPSGASSPLAQSGLESVGLDGQVSPGTPPLNAATGGQGATSFYTGAGVTPDASFTFDTVQRNLLSPGSPVQPPTGINVPGSPTTPATVTPTRATQLVPNYSETGFVQRYNIVGVPRTVLSTRYLQ